MGRILAEKGFLPIIIAEAAEIQSAKRPKRDLSALFTLWLTGDVSEIIGISHQSRWHSLVDANQLKLPKNC